MSVLARLIVDDILIIRNEIFHKSIPGPVRCVESYHITNRTSPRIFCEFPHSHDAQPRFRSHVKSMGDFSLLK